MLRTLLALMLLSFGCLGSQNPLQARIDALSEGEVLTLSAAEYVGPLVIDKAIAIVGEPGTIIDAGGKGSAVTIKAAGVSCRGLRYVTGAAIFMNMIPGCVCCRGPMMSACCSLSCRGLDLAFMASSSNARKWNTAT